MSNTKQSGFSMVVEIIAVVLVIGVLGFIGWRLFNHADVAKNSQNTTQSTISKTNQNMSSTQPTDPNAGYFVIKEWGVRFKPVSGLTNLEYTIRDSNSIAVFSTQQLISSDANCSDQANGYSGIGSLIRATAGSTAPFHGTFLITVSGYDYYYGGSGGASCVTDPNNSTGRTLMQNEQADFSSSIKSLQAAQQNTSPATPQPTYLDIKEMGIKFQLDDSIKDATYDIGTDTDGSKFAYISTASLTTASNGTCSAQEGGFASVIKAVGQLPQRFGQTIQPNGINVIQLGSDTYISYSAPNGSCTDNVTAGTLYSQQRQAFYNDFKTVQFDQ